MGKLLEQMTWKEAEEQLGASTVIVVALGAAAKEHGLHLQLRNDWLLAEYLKGRVLAESDVIILPTLNYAFYPAFVEYPGSITLSAETTSRMICEICRSISSYGPKRFYVINTGISTLKPLAAAAADLQNDGIMLAYTDLEAALEVGSLSELMSQEGGSHADEVETSMMLYIAPATVNMSLARKDFQADSSGRLSRNPDAGLSYSPSGVWGDARLASKDKGEKVVKCLIEHILGEIEQLRRSPCGKN